MNPQQVISQITGLLSRCQIQPPASRNRRRKRRAGPQAGAVPLGAPPGPAPRPASVGQGAGRRRRRIRRRTQGGPMADPRSGDVIISKTEILGSVDIKASGKAASGHFDLVPDSFPWLKAVFKGFERVRWTSVRVWWVSKVPATVGGTVCMGIDWDGTGNPDSVAKMASYSPNRSCPVYASSQSCNIIVPADRLRGRLWYTPLTGDWPDKSPCYIRYALEPSTAPDKDTSYGYIYCSYTCVLSGTRNA